MNTYAITGTAVHLHSGAVRLTRAQAAVRMHALSALDNDEYAIIRPVAFKRGEEIGYDGDMPKALAALMEPAPAQHPVQDGTTPPTAPPVAKPAGKSRKKLF